jgi:hypothetical protein
MLGRKIARVLVCGVFDGGGRDSGVASLVGAEIFNTEDIYERRGRVKEFF